MLDEGMSQLHPDGCSLQFRGQRRMSTDVSMNLREQIMYSSHTSARMACHIVERLRRRADTSDHIELWKYHYVDRR